MESLNLVNDMISIIERSQMYNQQYIDNKEHIKILDRNEKKIRKKNIDLQSKIETLKEQIKDNNEEIQDIKVSKKSLREKLSIKRIVDNWFN